MMEEEKQTLEMSSREINLARLQSSLDAQDMARMGKKQELKRSFKDLSAIGLTCTMMGTWEAMLTTASFSLTNGGLAGTIWVYIGAWFCTICVVLTMAEMASMAPTSGGQYHWVSEFSPPQYQRFLSYIVGWLSALGWQAAIATTAFASAGIIQGIVTLNYPDYDAKQWHATLMTIAVAFVATVANTFGARHLARLEVIILFLHIVGLFVVLIPLWVLAPTTSASKVFTEFSNYGGWSSIGGAVVVGLITPASSLSGYDAAAHMAEEVRDASKAVPRAMIWTIMLNGFLGFATIITFCFCITDLASVLAFPGSFPFVEVFRSATGSVLGATLMSTVVVALTICTCISALAAASRQVYAFARDEGLPYSSFFRAITTSTIITEGTELPLNGVLSSLIITIILALINLGSEAAFTSIVGVCTGASGTAYALSLGCLLWRRTTKNPTLDPLPPRRFSLGKLGVPLNVLSVLYVVLSMTVCFFPTTKDVTVETMSWSSVVFVGVILFAIGAYWAGGRKKYKGPVVLVQKMG